jgi:hypothetical protein
MEIFNKQVKNYLRHYVDYLQDDWLDYLPDAELAGVTVLLTALSAFFANHGYHPRTGFEPPGTYEGRGKAEIEHADKIVTRTEEIREHLREHIAWALTSVLHYITIYRQRTEVKGNPSYTFLLGCI